MNVTDLQRDINEALKLLEAIGAANIVFSKLCLSPLSDREVIKRADAIRWSLLMYCNDIANMVAQWRGELGEVLQEEGRKPNKQFATLLLAVAASATRER